MRAKKAELKRKEEAARAEQEAERIRLEKEAAEEAERIRLEEMESIPAPAENIITRIITTVTILVLWVCSSVMKAVRFVLHLPMSALYSVVDMLRSAWALLVWFGNLFIRPLQAIGRAFVNVGKGLKALGVIVWKFLLIAGPILLGFNIVAFAIIKLNIFPALHPCLTAIHDFIDYIKP